MSGHRPITRESESSPGPKCARGRIVAVFDRVNIDHQIMGGVPCIRGTRIPVATVVGMVADGMAEDEILSEFPQLSVDDIREALRYAAAAVDERELPLRPAG
jgi:uncharacterized protein (DUF433 family)